MITRLKFISYFTAVAVIFNVVALISCSGSDVADDKPILQDPTEDPVEETPIDDPIETPETGLSLDYIKGFRWKNGSDGTLIPALAGLVNVDAMKKAATMANSATVDFGQYHLWGHSDVMVLKGFMDVVAEDTPDSFWYLNTRCHKGETEHIAWFIEESSYLINNGPVSKIAGVRLGETQINNMDTHLNVVLQLVKGINAKTNNWLKSHTFIMSSVGMGWSWDKLENSHSTIIDEIKAEVGTLKYAWKVYSAATGGLVKLFADNGYTDVSSSSQWEAFFKIDGGLSKLKEKGIKVVFTGMTWDSFKLRDDETEAMHEAIVNCMAYLESKDYLACLPFAPGNNQNAILKVEENTGGASFQELPYYNLWYNFSE